MGWVQVELVIVEASIQMLRPQLLYLPLAWELSVNGATRTSDPKLHFTKIGTPASVSRLAIVEPRQGPEDQRKPCAVDPATMKHSKLKLNPGQGREKYCFRRRQ